MHKAKREKRINIPSSRYWVIAACLAFTVATIIFRYPNTEKDEFRNSNATYHVLMTMQAYDETPASVHKFVPLVTLGNESDRYIPWSITIEAADGIYYYPSFSGASFTAPYLFTKLFRLPINPESLYIFNSVLLMAALLLCLVFFTKIFQDRLRTEYILLMVTFGFAMQNEVMHGMGLVYWAQSLYMVVFLLQLCCYYGRKHPFLKVSFFILCAVGPYVEWTGFVANAGFCVVLLFQNGAIVRQGKRIVLNGRKWLAPIGVGLLTVFSLALFVGHLSLVLPLNSILESLLSRFSARNYSQPFSLFLILHGYYQTCGLLLVVTLTSVLSALIFPKARQRFLSVFKQQWAAFVLLSVPLLENLLMLQHAYEYTYDRMKVVLPLLFLLLASVYALGAYVPHRKTKMNACAVAITSVLFLFGLFNLWRYQTTDNFYRYEVSYLPQNQNFRTHFNHQFTPGNSVVGNSVNTSAYSVWFLGRNQYEMYHLETLVKLARDTGKRYAVLIITDGAQSMSQLDNYVMYDRDTDEIFFVSITGDTASYELRENDIYEYVQ